MTKTPAFEIDAHCDVARLTGTFHRMTRGLWLRVGMATVTAVMGCKHEPSWDEKVAAYNAAINAEIAKAAPLYTLLATIRANVAHPAPPCTAPPPAGYLRIPSRKLKTLTGDPTIGADGNFTADPAPQPEHAMWRSDSIDLLEDTNVTKRTGVGTVEDLQRIQGSAVATVMAAPGFVVQTVEALDLPQSDIAVPHAANSMPELEHTTKFISGRVAGRFLVVERDGKPRCQFTYEAKNHAHFSSEGTIAGSVYVDLESAVYEAFTAVTGST